MKLPELKRSCQRRNRVEKVSRAACGVIVILTAVFPTPLVFRSASYLPFSPLLLACDLVSS